MELVNQVVVVMRGSPELYIGAKGVEGKGKGTEGGVAPMRE